jgi:anti-sigma factor RsiW
MRDCIGEGTLQTWFDSELSADEALSVTAHLSVCARCAEAARTLRAENSVVTAAMAAQFTETVPSERLRQRLDRRIARFHYETASKTSESRWRALGSLFAFRPLAYGSIAALILLVAFLGFMYFKKPSVQPIIAGKPKQEIVPHQEIVPPLPQVSPEQKQLVVKNNPPAPRVHPRQPRNAAAPETAEASLAKRQNEYERTIAKLDQAMQTKPPMGPALQVEYEHSLAVINNAIAATRDVARKNPKDPQAAQFVLTAYQSKVDLMNQFADLR